MIYVHGRNEGERGEINVHSKVGFCREMVKDLYPNPFHTALENINRGTIITEAGSEFQYLNTLTEKANPLHRR